MATPTPGITPRSQETLVSLLAAIQSGDIDPPSADVLKKVLAGEMTLEQIAARQGKDVAAIRARTEGGIRKMQARSNLDLKKQLQTRQMERSAANEVKAAEKQMVSGAKKALQHVRGTSAAKNYGKLESEIKNANVILGKLTDPEAISSLQREISTADDRVLKLQQEAATITEKRTAATVKKHGLTGEAAETLASKAKDLSQTGKGIATVSALDAEAANIARTAKPAAGGFLGRIAKSPGKAALGAGLGGLLIASLLGGKGKQEEQGLPPVLQAQLAVEQIRAQASGQKTNKDLVNAMRIISMMKTMQGMAGAAAPQEASLF
jgi:hypothetical protein